MQILGDLSAWGIVLAFAVFLVSWIYNAFWLKRGILIPPQDPGLLGLIEAFGLGGKTTILAFLIFAISIVFFVAYLLI